MLREIVEMESARNWRLPLVIVMEPERPELIVDLVSTYLFYNLILSVIMN